MAYELDVPPVVKEAFNKWQTEVFYPKLNVLLRQSCEELEAVGLAENKLIGVAITTLIGYGISSMNTNFPGFDKEALMQDFSDVFDRVQGTTTKPQ